mmetsp:Transcript_35843/g.46048  ORF Transcript_35843/g.46048 Transcript_35843/m.46048 type:complete len:121 (+) Transcript_35843:290-652(+)
MLEKAKKKKKTPLRFFRIGILEYYNASLCLLMYQLGVFEENACNCTNSANKNHSTELEGHNAHLKKFNENSIQIQMSPNEQKYAYSKIQKDIQLYQYALGLFHDRAEAIRNSTGVKIFCE